MVIQLSGLLIAVESIGMANSFGFVLTLDKHILQTLAASLARITLWKYYNWFRVAEFLVGILLFVLYIIILYEYNNNCSIMCYGLLYQMYLNQYIFLVLPVFLLFTFFNFMIDFYYVIMLEIKVWQCQHFLLILINYMKIKKSINNNCSIFLVSNEFY